MSPKRSNTDMIKALEEKLEAAKAKEAEKATTRAAYLIEAIKTVDEKISKADASCDKAIKTATDLRDQRIAKLEAKRADLDAELADLAVDTASTSQLSFDEAEAEEYTESPRNTLFPDMTQLHKVTLGQRSGVILVGSK